MNIINTIGRKLQSPLQNLPKAVKKNTNNATELISNNKAQVHSEEILAQYTTNICTLKQNQDNFNLFLQNFIYENDKTFDISLKNIDLNKYTSSGIPLKYSRKSMIEDLTSALNLLSPQKQNEALNYFGIEKSIYNDFDGIPILFHDNATPKDFEAVEKILKKFCLNNEADTKIPQEKHFFNNLIKNFPEFNMIIGKTQHGTHDSTLDIHTLETLKKAINNPRYKILENDDKAVLKLTTLMHDFGKKACLITLEHPDLGANIAKYLFCTKYAFIDKAIQARTYNLIKNHDWFSKYNTETIGALGVKLTFRKDPKQIEVAKIFTKADFESINPRFHFTCLTGQLLSEDEYEKAFAQKMDSIPTLPINMYEFLDTINMSNRTPAGRIEKITMGKALNEEQKDIYSKSLSAFKKARCERIHHENVQPILNENNLLHGTQIGYLPDIMIDGLIAREFSGNKSTQIGGKTVDTLTPLCADVWDIRKKQVLQIILI